MRSTLAARGLLALFLFLVITSNLAYVNAHQNVSPLLIAPSIIPPKTPSTPTIGHAPVIFPVSGIKRVLVIAVAFSDVPPTLSIDQVRKLWTGTVDAYYHEISYGKLSLQSDVYGWYKLPYPLEHYGRNCRYINDVDCSGVNQSWHLAVDTVPLVKNVTFANYDYFVFIHSGRGQETSGVDYDVWSISYFGASITTRSKTLTGFSIVPELEAPPYVPYGDWCVELAHQLGVPDLFNSSYGPYFGATTLGMWELMDKGSWNGEGWKPAHMTAWPKIQLGFITGPALAIAQPGESSTYTIAPTEIPSNNTHAVKIFLNNTNQNEYYLVEVRALIGFDSVLPSTGVLITYVDETLLVNKVHIMDAHPNEGDLTGATWDVGQTFTDADHNLAIKVIAETGNSYQIAVIRGNSTTTNAAPSATDNSTATTQIAIAGVNLTVEIAKTTSAQEKGLSGRASLPIDHGMLFVFDHQDYWAFWMIDMKFPLDIIWFNSAHQVVYSVQNLQPCTPDNCPTFTPDATASYVLEVNAGFVATHHIKLGTAFTIVDPNAGKAIAADGMTLSRSILKTKPQNYAVNYSKV